MAKRAAAETAETEIESSNVAASAAAGADGGGAPPASPTALPRPVTFVDHDGKQYPAELIAEYPVEITKQVKGKWTKVQVLHGTVRFKRAGIRQQMEETERSGIRRYDRLWNVDQKAFYKEV